VERRNKSCIVPRVYASAKEINQQEKIHTEDKKAKEKAANDAL
jgi:hypothetical protein